MSLVSRGFGALNRIITRGFFQSENIKPVGYLTAKTSVYSALSAQCSIDSALFANCDTQQSLEAKINVSN